MVRILLAPNSFKGSATASQVIQLLRDAFTDLSHPGNIHLTACPISDGGDGFLDIAAISLTESKALTYSFSAYYDGSVDSAEVRYDERSKTVIIESARIIGLAKNQDKFPKPLHYNTFSIGDLIQKLFIERDSGELSFDRIVFGLGGSGTNDLGLGAASAFGLKIYDDQLNQLEVIPNNFDKIKSVVLPAKRSEVKIEVIHDVNIPLLGPDGPSLAFSRQKGATPEQALQMEHGNQNVIRLLSNRLNMPDLYKLNGAAGGLALGLSLVFGLTFRSSREFLLDDLRIEDKIVGNDLIITGEGRFDRQSLMEKGPGILMELCRKHRKEFILICGENELKGESVLYGEFVELREAGESLESAILRFPERLRSVVKDIISKSKI